MMRAASLGIAGCVTEKELSPEYILPYAYDKRAHDCVADAVKRATIETGVSKLYKKV